MDDLPLRRGRQRDPQVTLELLDAIERQSRPVLEKADHARRRLVVFLFAHPRGRLGREHLPAQIAAQTVELVDRSPQRGHPLDAQQHRRLQQRIDFALDARGTPAAAVQGGVRHRDLLGPAVGYRAVAAVARRLGLLGWRWLRPRVLRWRARGAATVGWRLAHDPARLLGRRAEQELAQPRECRPLGLQLLGHEGQRLYRRRQRRMLLLSQP